MEEFLCDTFRLCVFSWSCPVSIKPQRKNGMRMSIKNNSNSQMNAAQMSLSKITFRDDETILDVGCGDGKITAQIAHMLPRHCSASIFRTI